MTHRTIAWVAGLARVVLALLLGTAAGAGQGQENGRSWSHERTLRPGAPGPNRADVDVPLLSAAEPFRVARRLADDSQRGDSWIASGGLKDLRLLDESGREVPYLLVEPPGTAPAWMAAPSLLPVGATKTSSGFECDLGRLAAVDRLRVEGLPPPFLKRVRLEGSGDRSRWTLLVAEASLFHLPGEQLERLDLDFEGGRFRYVRLTWNDASSARLPLPRSCVARLVSTHSSPAAPRVAIPFERGASEPGVSRYRLRLPGPRLPVTAIEIEVEGGNVLRSARVNEGRLAEGEVVPVALGRAMLRRAVRENGAASDLRVPVEQPREPDLELVVDDGDNPPLAITGVAAVLAQLPWIYFESPDGRPLRAVFGARGLEAPRYDLEAARASLDTARVANATWEEPKAIAAAGRPEPGAALPATGAPIDAAAFRFRRAIPAGPPGLTALALDPAALANSRIEDLRIATADGRQVPYLLEKLDAPLAVELTALEPGGSDAPDLPRLDGGARSVYRLQLPAANLPPARLVLSTPARVFDRRVQVLVAPGRGRDRAGAVAEGRWQHGDPDTPARALALGLPTLATSVAWLVVDEGDNQPLQINAPALLLPAYRLRFYRDADAELQLLYGQEGLGAPRYDLALLAPKLLGAAATDVRPAPEQAPASERAAPWMMLFWGALVLAAVALLAMVVRLVRS